MGWGGLRGLEVGILLLVCDGREVDWFRNWGRFEALGRLILYLVLLILVVLLVVGREGWGVFVMDPSHAVSLGHYAAAVSG